MKITLILVGKTDKGYLTDAVAEYESRIKHYMNFELKIIPELKNTKSLSADQQKELEGKLLVQHFENYDSVILLDEQGKEYRSIEFAKMIDQKGINGTRNLAFVVGGPYGYSNEVYQAVSSKIALSKLTFSHQMVRLVFVEQLYRAMTIIKGEPYHHE